MWCPRTLTIRRGARTAVYFLVPELLACRSGPDRGGLGIDARQAPRRRVLRSLDSAGVKTELDRAGPDEMYVARIQQPAYLAAMQLGFEMERIRLDGRFIGQNELSTHGHQFATLPAGHGEPCLPADLNAVRPGRQGGSQHPLHGLAPGRWSRPGQTRAGALACRPRRPLSPVDTGGADVAWPR